MVYYVLCHCIDNGVRVRYFFACCNLLRNARRMHHEIVVNTKESKEFSILMETSHQNFNSVRREGFYECLLLFSNSDIFVSFYLIPYFKYNFIALFLL